MTETAILAIISASAGVIGAAIGAAGGYFASARLARFDERKQIREFGMKIGLTNFEVHREVAQRVANATGTMHHTPPLKAFIVQGLKTMEIIADPKLSTDEMARRIGDADDFAQAIVAAARDRQRGTDSTNG